ncbi:MAG: cytochrome C oxidase subunit IV family protein [Acidimicrobiia bacterium]|jgi:cytochrome c oxidase subunit 4
MAQATTTKTTAKRHPTPALYWGIAIFLAAVTGMEISVPNIDIPDAVKVPLLIVLGAIKFAVVVMFFMHLRYDKKLYRNLFLFGVIGVIPLFTVVLLAMHAFT